jgi:hypothetical protein
MRPSKHLVPDLTKFQMAAKSCGTRLACTATFGGIILFERRRVFLTTVDVAEGKLRSVAEPQCGSVTRPALQPTSVFRFSTHCPPIREFNTCGIRVNKELLDASWSARRLRNLISMTGNSRWSGCIIVKDNKRAIYP